jgi:hypothetical protein
MGRRVSGPTRLAELDHGQFSGLVDEQIDARFPGERHRRTADKYRWRFPDGESYADADPRAAGALRQISRRPVKRPLTVSHEMIGRMLQRHRLGLDPQVALARSHPHDVVFEIDPAAPDCRPLAPDPDLRRAITEPCQAPMAGPVTWPGITATAAQTATTPERRTAGHGRDEPRRPQHSARRKAGLVGNPDRTAARAHDRTRLRAGNVPGARPGGGPSAWSAAGCR